MAINFISGISWNQLIYATSYSLQAPWLLSDFSFTFLFGFFLFGYSLLCKNIKWRNIYVVAFSLFFYYKSSGPFLLVFVCLILSDFLFAKLIEKRDGTKKKILFYLSIIYSLSFLLYFKYSSTIICNSNEYLGTNFSLNDWFLPLGISFYTFQSISYLVDVYRREVPPVKSITDYAFYMTFFPHIIAGPIIRAKDFIPQLSSPTILNSSTYKESMIRITTGLIKKLLIADYLGTYVSLINESPINHTGLEHFISMYAFSFQLYFDLSGYADIAICIALLLGFRIKENFDSPYLARNIRSFWRKWHISISNWFKDYIYIPLGGNNGKLISSYILLIFIMVLGGLWHGMEKRFIMLGLIHGVALVIHKIYLKYFPMQSKSKVFSIIAVLITFHFVSFGWFFLRASSFDYAIQSLTILFTKTNFMQLYSFTMERPELIILLILSGCFVFMPGKLKRYLNDKAMKLPAISWVFLFLIVLQLIIQFKGQLPPPFIYLQF